MVCLFISQKKKNDFFIALWKIVFIIKEMKHMELFKYFDEPSQVERSVTHDGKLHVFVCFYRY